MPSRRRANKNVKHEARPTNHVPPRAVPWIWLTLATLVHVVAFVQILDTPFARLDLWRQTDMHYYATWAQHIADGDWRSGELPLPIHRWHHEVAEKARATNPAMRMLSDEALWGRWMRSPQFYQDPLYAYLLAVLYAMGAGPLTMLACQLALGVLAVVLVWYLSCVYFGNRVGAVAAALASLSAPLVFYELILLRDAIIAVVGLAIVWLLEYTRQQRLSGALGLGVLLGLGILLKGTLIFLVIVVLALIAVWVASKRIAAARGAAVLAACVVVLAPAMTRNLAVGVPPLALASSGPLTFFSANEPHALPDVGFGIDVDALSMWLTQTDGGWRSAVRSAL